MNYRLQRLSEKRARDIEAYDWIGRQKKEFKKDPSWFFFNILFFVYITFSSGFLIVLAYEMIFGRLAFWRHQ